MRNCSSPGVALLDRKPGHRKALARKEKPKAGGFAISFPEYFLLIGILHADSVIFVYYYHALIRSFTGEQDRSATRLSSPIVYHPVQDKV